MAGVLMLGLAVISISLNYHVGKKGRCGLHYKVTYIIIGMIVVSSVLPVAYKNSYRCLYR